MNLEKFESKKLDKKQLFPIGGVASLSDATNSHGNATRTTGSDSDTTTSDGDDDQCEG